MIYLRSHSLWRVSLITAMFHSTKYTAAWLGVNCVKKQESWKMFPQTHHSSNLPLRRNGLQQILIPIFHNYWNLWIVNFCATQTSSASVKDVVRSCCIMIYLTKPATITTSEICSMTWLLINSSYMSWKKFLHSYATDVLLLRKKIILFIKNRIHYDCMEYIPKRKFRLHSDYPHLNENLLHAKELNVWKPSNSKLCMLT